MKPVVVGRRSGRRGQGPPVGCVAEQSPDSAALAPVQYGKEDDSRLVADLEEQVRVYDTDTRQICHPLWLRLVCRQDRLDPLGPHTPLASARHL